MRHGDFMGDEEKAEVLKKCLDEAKGMPQEEREGYIKQCLQQNQLVTIKV